MSDYDTERTIPMWLPVTALIVAIAIIIVAWWVKAADLRRSSTMVTQAPQTVTQKPSPPPQEIQPGENAASADVYLDTSQSKPKIVLLPKGQQTGQTSSLKKLSIPSQFQLNGKTWQPSGETLSGDNLHMKEAGPEIGGSAVCIPSDAQTPYTDLYLETDSGSGVFADYRPTS